jgi:hypothetical protein
MTARLETRLTKMQSFAETASKPYARIVARYLRGFTDFLLRSR